MRPAAVAAFVAVGVAANLILLLFLVRAEERLQRRFRAAAALRHAAADAILPASAVPHMGPAALRSPA